ncbi:MAG: undecaprenyldiphospho-muramoylpentapeptide beta-N-acetylglucosaminyltransferase [Spirochaetes bacterium]|nr:undecaprenyldiphospho-muramoylpentapeptide beta-N-acetylglucosaminyltransferase [Spirochaetota bacterium]
MLNNNIKIIFTGGGSGGHTMPALAMIKTLQKHYDKKKIKYEILYIGSKDSIEKSIIEKHNINYKTISTGKFRRYFSLKNITDIFNVIKGFFDSIKIIKNFKPHIIFSTGGFVSVPPVIAGYFKKIPILIHEQTIDAGLANKIAGVFATKIALTFNESKKYFKSKKCIFTGIPLREEIFSGKKENAYKKFGFDKKIPVVYFTGGGLGSHILNLSSFKFLPQLLENANVIFQTGSSFNSKDYLMMLKLRDGLPENKKRRFIVYNFINEDIADIYSIVSLAVGRSGSGTVNEFMALKIPAIYIPLKIATNNEQYKNASVHVKNKSAMIIEEKDLTKDNLFNAISDILFTDKIKTMKKNLNKLNHQSGNKKLLNLIENMIKLKL